MTVSEIIALLPIDDKIIIRKRWIQAGRVVVLAVAHPAAMEHVTADLLSLEVNSIYGSDGGIVLEHIEDEII